ncbi:ABC-type transport system ATP-binding protein (probable substrate tungstate) [Halobacterium hubeiense]|uniref:ABC-type transport system ATP-binding protein (Probable substrate tungstate) n=1 Tax=Halobacterium hubeiense TaxID=1407499 RepID=A0A0U5H722_9EURY|nr:phosphate ABC transporter ATP-binding protein [Halobacterium hubeiense]CQH59733.1 ABC-type transport system ATP-binding protein (probable substrate tungstate) [Halobacterium hubeiense]
MSLDARGVTHAYEDADDPVFRDVSLTVAPGEVVAVIGPSGVGKTTLLRLLGLFTPPDEGTVAVGGTDAWSLASDERLALRRRVGVVFQEASLFDTSVARNVEYGLRVRRSWRERVRDELRALVGDDEPPAAVRDALDVVGLGDYVDTPADSLSGGEAQRVAFARALAYDPDFLLLDEPTSDLDPRNTAVIEDATTAAAERDIGVVVATHDMNQARRVADRVAVLLDDSIIEAGPADRVFETPRDERARQFIDGELVY